MKEVKSFNLRLDKELWFFLRQEAHDKEMSINEIINRCLLRYKDRKEKKLTDKDDMVP